MQPVEDLTSEVNPDVTDNPGFQELLRYWEGKRQGRTMPTRQDVDPLDMKDHLGSLFLVEPVNDMAEFRYRLVGVHLTQVQGRDFTGRTVTEIFGGLDAKYAASAIAAYRKVLQEGVVLRTRGKLVWTQKEFISFDSLHLPLATNDGKPGFVLGKLVFEKGATR